MVRILSRQKASLVFFLFFLSVPLAHAAETEKDLEGIKKKIAKEKQEITKVQKKEGSVLQSLEKIDGALERKNAELNKVNSRFEAILVELQKKEQEVEKVGSSLRGRRDLLTRRARALY